MNEADLISDHQSHQGNTQYECIFFHHRTFLLEGVLPDDRLNNQSFNKCTFFKSFTISCPFGMRNNSCSVTPLRSIMATI